MPSIQSVGNNIGLRAHHLISIPVEFTMSSLMTLAGIAKSFQNLAYSFISIAGNNETMEESFDNGLEFLEAARVMMPLSYFHFINVIYPDVISQKTALGNESYLVNIVNKKITANAEKLVTGNFFNRHITARLAFIGELVAKIVARIVSFPFGCIAALFSLLPISLVSKENHTMLAEYAAPRLAISGLIKDVFVIGMKIINPQLVHTFREFEKQYLNQ